VPKQLEAIDEAEVESAERRVRDRGFVAASKLMGGKSSARLRAALVDALVARGLERARRGVRVPPSEQLESALGAARALSMAGLHERLSGVSAREARAAAHALVRASRAVLTREGRRELLLVVDDRTLSAAETGALAGAAKLIDGVAKRLRELLRAAKPTRARPATSVLRSDARAVATDLEDAARAATSAAGKAAPKAEPAPIARVLDKARDLEIDGLGLVYVPDLVRALDELGAGGVHAALRAAADTGQIELRPESGLDRLSAEERAACLVGPSGRLVSYVRLR
jgi:hypothetical protein